MATAKPKRSPRTGNKDQQKFTFQLGLSNFLFLAILVVIGMAWSFILGVIVGRGHQPEKVAAEMAHKVLPEDFPLLTDNNEQVLSGEELEFFDKLKRSPSSRTTPKPATPPPASPAPKKAPEPAKPQPETKTKQTALQAAQQLADAREQATADTGKDQVFVFNYQVAALESMEQAQRVIKQLTPGGFKTSVIQASHAGKTWFRVYVHHQGSVPSAEALKEKLKGYGISNTLLRSRTPL